MPRNSDQSGSPPPRVICLGALTPAPMLIVEMMSKTTYRYRIDTLDGVIRREVEGVLVALPTLSEVPLFSKLHLPFGKMADELSADQIDAILAADACTCFLRVDRTRLSSSLYGWLYVTADSPGTTILEDYPGYSGPLYGFGRTTAVLVWAP